ncbi:VanW family protein [Neobacillus cucumis]|uniref:VanW family protein n=1 Tax=Neobacillus cucumis TaxID=1740721 RepID=UPI0019663F3C|nr:VanW family protein [Neobacillus cucumis]MBM7655017.1 vancomycin resistance protein YoaR [Neobacillus cucumis]
MILSCILGIILTSQPNNFTDYLVITKNRIHVTTIKQEDFSYPYSELPIIDTKKFNQFLDNLDKHFSSTPENASIGSNGEIVAEKIGSRIHRQSFTEQLYAYFFSHRSNTLEIPMLPVYPKVDSELLSDIRNMRIGRYVTVFNPTNKTRTNNIDLATKAINNYVIFPGETFSFNKVVGKRTASKGYLKAPVIIRGEFSEDIGGGICQVSSTLFNAVDNAGLKIVQRFSHTRKVPYIPPGRDATVSWYGPDFVFKNIYKEPILIRAKTLGHLLVINLYSSETIEYKPKKVPIAPY